MQDESPLENGPDPAHLRFLRRLVTVLTATMIAGVLVVVALLVIRLQAPPATLALPDALALPEGTTARAITRGSDWWAIVTDDDRILIYSRDGVLRQSLAIE